MLRSFAASEVPGLCIWVSSTFTNSLMVAVLRSVISDRFGILGMLHTVPAALRAGLLRDSTGIELARQIKAMKPTVPLVMYSGIPPASMRNLDGFINKGEPVQALLAFIRDLVHRFWE